ncbi:MAG: transposase [Nostoc sp. CmiVER01]|uniref:transposase n=1 Tax=Nostoc sp. CmiVER01 TaxID=3075384 RepID=UPI002AD50CB6|nr:transposase [Nostoc sp. CmiVER01]MDZ8127250.1 transposase [Nostoc sp. CmiVER01]
MLVERVGRGLNPLPTPSSLHPTPHTLHPVQVLLGDRAFCAYADMVSITQLGCDAVFRKHQSRTTTIRKGKIVGDCDKLVTWYKPKQCPQGLSKDDFDALPSSITVREIYYYILIPGFRTQQVSLITTLLDKSSYSTLEIVGLYGKRWDVELDLRHIKTTLGMDILRCKTPPMIRKEIHVYRTEFRSQESEFRMNSV